MQIKSNNVLFFVQIVSWLSSVKKYYCIFIEQN